MGLNASDWATLRRLIQQFLDKSIPDGGLSSDDQQFTTITGMSTKSLKADWDKGKITTSCNAFLGWVADQIGVKRGSVLRGALDISKAQGEVPGSGCWIEANSASSIDAGLHPQAGDFYSSPHHFKDWTQKWGHVGVVYSFDPVAQEWTLVEGGQGGPKMGLDYIKWSTKKFDRTKINGWVDIARYMLPNGPAVDPETAARERTALENDMLNQMRAWELSDR